MVIKKTKVESYISIDKLIRCFGDSVPDSIIVGGSYSTNEHNITRLEHKEYWLSDIDLLCIRKNEFSLEEANLVYRRMLTYSNSLKQANPYFHIGLKLRSPAQLFYEANSLYFRELSENSSSILGQEFLYYFNSGQTFGFFTDSNKPSNETLSSLISCAITRLWCNVLFFPSSLYRKDSKEFGLWYNYFFSRGCLDWVTWCLIEQGSWVNGYCNRFDRWKKFKSVNKSQVRLMEACLETKIGKINIDYREIIAPALELIFSYIKDLMKRLSLTPSSEFQFVYSMNKFIEAKSTGYSENCSKKYLRLAERALSDVIGFDVCNISASSDENKWLSFRKAYSDFRFARNKQDYQDHNVFTEHFLQLGR